MAGPPGQVAVTKEVYESVSAWEQGYISYMQGAWNKDVPDKNPYPVSTPAYEMWGNGNQAAMLQVQDGEE